MKAKNSKNKNLIKNEKVEKFLTSFFLGIIEKNYEESNLYCNFLYN